MVNQYMSLYLCLFERYFRVLNYKWVTWSWPLPLWGNYIIILRTLDICLKNLTTLVSAILDMIGALKWLCPRDHTSFKNDLSSIGWLLQWLSYVENRVFGVIYLREMSAQVTRYLVECIQLQLIETTVCAYVHVGPTVFRCNELSKVADLNIFFAFGNFGVYMYVESDPSRASIRFLASKNYRVRGLFSSIVCMILQWHRGLWMDRQTDNQPGGQTQANRHNSSIASRGKNDVM